MRTIVCLFSLLCTVYSQRVMDPIDGPIEQPIEQPIEEPHQPANKGCLFEGKIYPVGQFKPNDCMICHCQLAGQKNCAIMDCGPILCANPVKILGQCCPVCRGYNPSDYRPNIPRTNLP